jgi:hypothetical protein
MSMSRKRRKELVRLRKSADQLWSQQQEVLERANTLAREAGRQAGFLTREQVVPRVRESYDQYLRPSVLASQGLAGGASRRLQQYVIPTIGTALATAASVRDITKDARVRAALERMGLQKPVPQKRRPGVGAYVALGAGVVAAAGVGYAVWQTFRADDELWVADDEVQVSVKAQED